MYVKWFRPVKLSAWPELPACNGRRQGFGSRVHTETAAGGVAIAEEKVALAPRFVPEVICDGGCGTLIAHQGCGTITGPENGPPRRDAQPCRNRWFGERLAHAEASMEHGRTRRSPGYNQSSIMAVPV